MLPLGGTATAYRVGDLHGFADRMRRCADRDEAPRGPGVVVVRAHDIRRGTVRRHSEGDRVGVDLYGRAGDVCGRIDDGQRPRTGRAAGARNGCAGDDQRQRQRPRAGCGGCAGRHERGRHAGRGGVRSRAGDERCAGEERNGGRCGTKPSPSRDVRARANTATVSSFRT